MHEIVTLSVRFPRTPLKTHFLYTPLKILYGFYLVYFVSYLNYIKLIKEGYQTLLTDMQIVNIKRITYLVNTMSNVYKIINIKPQGK